MSIVPVVSQSQNQFTKPTSAPETLPCPCASGKPFNKCHGLRDVDMIAACERKLGFERVEVLHGSTFRDCSTVIIVPSRDRTFHYRVIQSWESMMHPMNQPRGKLYAIGDEVGIAYNNMIATVLSHPGLSSFKYILTLEADNLPPPDAHIRLLETIEQGKFDGVSGLYFTKGDYNMPMAYGDPARYAATGHLEFTPRDVASAIAAGQVMEVNGIACGCSLFRTDLFRRLPHPWYVTVSDLVGGQGPMGFTQDLNFCANAKKLLGARFAVDMRVKVGHIDVNSGVVY